METLSEADLRSLCEELRVHQIELELQNEELRAAKQETLESEEKFRDFYDFGLLAYFTFTGSGVIEETNLAGAELLKKPRQFLSGWPFQSFLESGSVPVFTSFCRQVMEGGEKETVELSLRRNGDSPVYIRVEGRAVEESDGWKRRFRAAVIDITERKQAEQKLQEAVHEKNLILDNTNAAIAFHDAENNFLWANKIYMDFAGVPMSELKGRKCYACWGLDRMCQHCPVTLAIKTGEPQEGEVTPENQPHWPAEQGSWLVRAAPVRDSEGNIIGAIEVAHDITDRKRAEEALVRRTEDLIRKSEELEAARDEANIYLDIMTHDVRNANNVSGMYADLLTELADGNLKTYAEKLHASIERSNEILRNVATVRRIHDEETSLVPINLDAVIQNEIGRFPEASIDYLDPQFEVLADGLLPTVFINLIGNAVKFGGPGVEITVRVEEKDGEVLVSVEDTGPGIPDEVKRLLFQRFERGMGRGRGEGLGLYIVRTLVERYGGKVWIEDRVPGRPGEGAAFRFTLRKANGNGGT